MFGTLTMEDDAKADVRKYVITMRSASGKRMWRTAQGTWTYLPAHAARFTSAEADELIKTLKPTDGSVAAPATKEQAA